MSAPVREIEIDAVLPKDSGPTPERMAGPRSRGRRSGPRRQARAASDDVVAALVAKLMDSLFKVPGTNIRVGLDPLIGLIPVAGSPISAVVSLMMIARSAAMGVPHRILAQMAMNVGINAMLDAVPVVGDAASVFFRSNARNYELMQKHAGTRRPMTSRDKLFLLLLVLGVLLVVALMFLGMLFLIRTGWEALVQMGW